MMSKKAPQDMNGNLGAYREMLASGSAVEGALILAKGLVLNRSRRLGDRSVLVHGLRSSHVIDELARQYGRAMGGYLAAIQERFRLKNAAEPPPGASGAAARRSVPRRKPD